ncbi:hypothetical protein ENH_00080380 [Eimeria necatrix]|uniref:Uncharacterized protein n=1 Tax=Eimeria necatrix TaxID=51315 RepID=U6MNV8_9EIME|nr:hypothetical protein ENH_00080380 [Eimeria necatrix]CDJ64758.1 hypothetical protein ENH_00080380 [Eimeria necatrix]
MLLSDASPSPVPLLSSADWGAPGPPAGLRGRGREPLVALQRLARLLLLRAAAADCCSSNSDSNADGQHLLWLASPRCNDAAVGELLEPLRGPPGAPSTCTP